jgi:hypothetical protein
MRAGWVGTIREFLETPCQTWMESLEFHHKARLGESPSESNRAAWMNCHRVLKNQLKQLGAARADVAHWGIAFEYELPRERGRRVDVVILAGDCVLVLEFKDFKDTLQAHIDQVAAYARDLSSYQAASHNHRIVPVLVNTLSRAECVDLGPIWVTGSDGLGTCMKRLEVAGIPWIAIAEWIKSPYAPLPSLVRAARMIFEHEPLPRIKQAESTGIAEAVTSVAKIVQLARSKSERHIVFITGVPGAGKTLTGLQLVYTLTLDRDRERAIGVFLSGNGPLISVLQYALRGNQVGRSPVDASRVFARDVLAFVRDHISPDSPLPPEHVWVYDEAQRAWDADMVAEKHRFHMSEPEMFLSLGERMPRWRLRLLSSDAPGCARIWARMPIAAHVSLLATSFVSGSCWRWTVASRLLAPC